MAAKKVLLLLNSDRFAFPLMRFLTEEGIRFGWKIQVGCMFDAGIGDRLREEAFPGDVKFINIGRVDECDQLIRKSDIVVGLTTDSLLLQIADRCIAHRRTLVSPARLSRQMALKKALAKESNVLILMDCGFSPGLDHITAKKAIDNICTKGGKITSFKTFSGSFISESSIDNPWKFKLAESAGEMISFGRHTNRHLLHGKMQHIPYHSLFERGEKIEIRDMENMVAIPEGDSLYYKKIYELQDAHTVVKGKLMQNGFDQMWQMLIKLGLTDTALKIDLGGDGSFYNFLDSFLPYSESATLEERLQEYARIDFRDIEKLKWLGLFDSGWVEGHKELTPSILLQYLMERKFKAESHDKDCVVIEHQLQYEFREECNEFKATFISQGSNQMDSALARAIGFTCGAAVKAVLLGSISLKGIQVPIIKEIYEPILNELSDLGVAFHVEDTKASVAQMN